MKLTIYTRKDCHLCDEAKATLRKCEVDLEEIDIDSDTELYQKYRYEIPVIFYEGRKLFKYRVDERKLRHFLKLQPKSDH